MPRTRSSHRRGPKRARVALVAATLALSFSLLGPSQSAAQAQDPGAASKASPPGAAGGKTLVVLTTSLGAEYGFAFLWLQNRYEREGRSAAPYPWLRRGSAAAR